MPLENSLTAGLMSTSTGSDTAIVICNGPSLKAVPNKWLDKFPTFGSNRVFLKYNPDVLVTLDLKMVHNKILQEEMYEGMMKSNDVFVSPIVEEYMEKEGVGLPYHATVLKAWSNITGPDGQLAPAFSRDPLQMLVSGGTVTYGLLQFAFWQGFRRILLVGLNHTFRDSRGDHFDERYNKDVGIPYERENMANPGSGPGEWFWSEVNFVKKVDWFYSIARQLFEEHGGQLINCTPDTLCTVLEIDDWRNY